MLEDRTGLSSIAQKCVKTNCTFSLIAWWVITCGNRHESQANTKGRNPNASFFSLSRPIRIPAKSLESGMAALEIDAKDKGLFFALVTTRIWSFKMNSWCKHHEKQSQTSRIIGNLWKGIRQIKVNREHPSVYTKNYILIPFNPRFNMF